MRKISRKTNISYPLIRTRYAYSLSHQAVRNVSFLESFAYVLNGWSKKTSENFHENTLAEIVELDPATLPKRFSWIATTYNGQKQYPKKPLLQSVPPWMFAKVCDTPLVTNSYICNDLLNESNWFIISAYWK